MSRLQGLAVLVVGCIVVTGCSTDTAADPTAVTEPTTWTTTSTPTPTPTPPTTEPDVTEPSLPATATKPGAQGAEAFVRYYIKLLNYAANTGDTDRLALSAERCGGCRSYVEKYNSVYQRGGYFKDPGWRPTSVTGRAFDDDIVVLAIVDAPAVTYVERKGADPQRGTDEEYSLRFEVRWAGDSWLVFRFGGQQA